MKLYFTKDESGNINVQIQKGTIPVDFDYIEMIRQLLENNEITTEWKNVEDSEKSQIEELLARIKLAVEEGLAKKQ